MRLLLLLILMLAVVVPSARCWFVVWTPASTSSCVRCKKIQPRLRHPRAMSLLLLHAKTPNKPVPSGISTFVEGSDYYDSMEEEIEAMGGDPFFLDTNNDDDNDENDATTPDFEWDGSVEEDAHMDFMD